MSKIKAISVYCGTASQVDQIYKDTAHAVGALLAKEQVRLVYGGATIGLMGIVADACMAGGGQVTGIIPKHIQDIEPMHQNLTELLVVDSMHTRKAMMVDKSDAFVILPGGFGTLDELFEVLTWKYLGLHDKPIVLVNAKGYFTPLVAMVNHMVDEGFTAFWHRGLFQVVDDASEIIVAACSQLGYMRPNLQHT